MINPISFVRFLFLCKNKFNQRYITMKKVCALIAGICLTAALFAANPYLIDLSKPADAAPQTVFKMGNAGPTGKEILVNSRYLTIAGKPVIPVMGEMHFTRVPRQKWEETLLKMKAGGVNVVAFYVFWNHHEEVEGQFNWSGLYDVREFVKLCAANGLYAYPRIGPWAHGEARNGGFPDWLLRKKQIKTRVNHPVYEEYVKRFFGEIAKQLQGLYYKDGGPVIGVQLENEYWRAKSGEAHIMWLKQLAQSLGIDVPLYTVTGWKNGSVPPFEVIPLFGAYPDAPWASHVRREVSEENFLFDNFRGNEKIGDETATQKQYMSYDEYPYFTCEMGIGIQNTYHRRLVIGPKDGLAMVTAKLGSGSNLPGYYVFAGGTNPQGLLHSQTEDRDETGYQNQNPDKSYDFQAAIGESGEVSQAYREVKKLHYFLHDFGSELAVAAPQIINNKPGELQLALRKNENSAFLFGINYCRYLPREMRKNVRFEVKLNENESFIFPEKDIQIPDSSVFIWPVNLSLDAFTLKYATAQALCKVKGGTVFYANGDIPTEFCFDAKGITTVEYDGRRIKPEGNQYVVNVRRPGIYSHIKITNSSGKSHFITVLSEKEALNAWVFDQNGENELYISDQTLALKNGNLQIYSASPKFTVLKYGPDAGFSLPDQKMTTSTDGLYVRYDIQQKLSVINPVLTEKSLFSDAKWLQANSQTKLTQKNQLHHRFFIKEFSLENPSQIRKATLYMASESLCRINVNNRWVQQEFKDSALNTIDLTAYLQNGENTLYLDFPFSEGIKSFAARIVVEYYNTQKTEILSDWSWLMKDSYTYPSELKSIGDFSEAVITAEPAIFHNLSSPDWKEWNITLPLIENTSLSDLILAMNYTGDVARIYSGHELVADHFNSNTEWRVSPLRFESSLRNELQLIVTKAHAQSVFQDIPTPAKLIGTAKLNKAKVETIGCVILEPRK